MTISITSIPTHLIEYRSFKKESLSSQPMILSIKIYILTSIISSLKLSLLWKIGQLASSSSKDMTIMDIAPLIL